MRDFGYPATMPLGIGWYAPHVVHIVWPGLPSDAEIVAMMARHDEMVAALGGPYGVLHEAETDEVPRLDSRHRRMLAKWIDDNHTTKHRNCRGVAYVTASPLARGVITAISWIGAPPYPSRTFDDRESAVAWLTPIVDAAWANEFATVRTLGSPKASSE